MYKVVYPPYKSFVCLGPECPMNCCEYYTIRLFKSEEALFDTREEWQDMDGDGNSIRKFIERENGFWKCKSHPEGGCIFWRNRLCSLQVKSGEKAMPVVCRTYPRIIARYDKFMQFGMEACCPAAAASVKDWSIGDFLYEGQVCGVPDATFEKRDSLIRMLADKDIPFEKCLTEMAEAYSSPVVVPTVRLDGMAEEFIRKVTALMVWSYIPYFEGVGEIDNIMSIILEAVGRFYGIAPKTAFDGWWDMSVSFSRMLVSYFLEIGFDVDHEDRYCDFAEYE